MDENQVNESTEVIETNEFQDPLDNFDLRTPAEVEASVQDDVEEEPEEKTAEPVEEEEKSQPEEKAVEEKPYQPPQKVQLQVKAFEKEIPVDEYGNIDPSKLGEYLQERDNHLKEVARVEAQNAYFENIYGQREWNDVGEAYPELVKDETTRGLIENLRVADAIRGGEGSLMEAAKTIKSLQDGAVAKGRESQQANITRQKTVTLKSSSRSQPSDANKLSSLRKKAVAGGADGESARLSLLSELYESGALNA